MWAMEYNPHIFSIYGEQGDSVERSANVKMKEKELKQYGKFERNNLKKGLAAEQNSAFSVFLVASVLEGN